MKNKTIRLLTEEQYPSFKAVKEKYTIDSGWKEIAQGKMGWFTACNKRVVRDNPFQGKSTYTVY
jgi:hypothetical protein